MNSKAPRRPPPKRPTAAKNAAIPSNETDEPKAFGRRRPHEVDPKGLAKHKSRPAGRTPRSSLLRSLVDRLFH